MLNIIWSAAICIGIAVCLVTQNFETASISFTEGAKKAVELCIFMLGTMSFWSGIMNIAEKSGLVDIISRKISPFIKLVFPDIPYGGKAFRYISVNMVANFLGLGWAATPAGLKAMEEMKRLNKDRKTASRSMCMFIIINVSSLQLLPINIIALRQKFLSSEPFMIIIPSIAATAFSTVFAVILAKIFERCEKR